MPGEKLQLISDSPCRRPIGKALMRKAIQGFGFVLTHVGVFFCLAAFVCCCCLFWFFFLNKNHYLAMLLFKNVRIRKR